jgi:hypothetical protein
MGPLAMTSAKKNLKHYTTSYQIGVLINKIPQGYVFKLKRTPI